ncbi:MAG TPA: hypothetical protein VNA17_06780, partial [Pyrinomonadaceae bacterium]|nr:hypothetical protein [Pyrinomonadaceae bacterium]
MDIRFGTSGWRAIIADEFTFANVRLVIQGICRYLTISEQRSGGKLVIGHDSRFMGEAFAAAAADIGASSGFEVLR